MPSIKDVSKKAGVSIATVSRVINNSHYVSPEVKKKVNEAIKELGYYPNYLARSLKKDNSYSIGFVVSDISNPYFTSMAKSLEDVVNEKSYNIIVCSTENSKERELSYLKLLLSKKVDGLVINTTGENDDFIEEISLTNLPIVLIDRKIETVDFIGDYITHDNIAGTQAITSHLLELGHRNIGVINGSLKVSTGRERFKGFKSAMKRFNIDIDQGYRYRYDGDFSIESGYNGTKRFMEMNEPPTAIVAMNNKMAIGALKYLRAYSVEVPDRVSLISYGDIDNTELLYIRPTIVTQDPQIIGSRAGEILLERINKKNKIRNREIMYLPQLIIRETTKAL